MFANSKIAVSFAAAILAFVGLFAVAAIVMNVKAESRGMARSAPDLVCTRFLC